jgi:hypothetical protein
MKLTSRLWLCLFAVVLQAACGTPGPPLPPSLELARPVTDLKATRKGNKVYLAWSAPSETTDKHNIKHAGTTEVCTNLGSALRECGTAVAKLPVQKSSEPKNGAAKIQTSYVAELPITAQSENPTGSIFYAVNVLNSYGRSAGLSNQVQLPAAPTLPPPDSFRARLTAEGVRLTWDPVSAPAIAGARFAYRIYRGQQGTNKDSVAGEVPVGSETTFLDQSFEWEKTYDYRAAVVTMITPEDRALENREQQVEGEDTPAVQLVAHDVFPPATPSGLQAVFSGPGRKPFIDLIWAPNSETDLAGYNVYRHEPGMRPLKINAELVKAPAFRDSAVVAGTQYSYSVSAVDVRGNESPQSEEANEALPAD